MNLSAVIAGHSRSKNGVTSRAYDPAIHLSKMRWMRGSSPRMKTIGSVGGWL
jgi:hypothetical protein